MKNTDSKQQNLDNTVQTPSQMKKRIKWGIIGTGAIARAFVNGVKGSKTGEVIAVASRTQKKADAFAKEFKIKKCYAGYEELLKDDEVEAVYIAIPHPFHAKWAIKTAKSGKHILCEKPITINYAQAMAVIEAARENDVFLMEAFMYRCHPQTHKLVELIKSNVIGTIQFIRAIFSFSTGWNPEARLLNNKLGGGGILDVGCYPVSAARLIAGAAAGKEFAEPIEVKAVGVIGKSGVDEYSSAIFKFPNNILAQVSCGVQLAEENTVTIYGTEGKMVIPEMWIPSREGGTTKILIYKNNQEPEEVEVTTDIPLYGNEADTVAEYISNRQAKSPAMSWDDTLGNMQVLDKWREEIGMIYDEEKVENQNTPAHGNPLTKKESSSMKYIEIPGLDKPISRMVMGGDNQNNIPFAFAMFDDYYERGGNAFDTAYIYGGGMQERLLGTWVQKRNIRDKVVIIGKGAHTPHCNPEAIRSQLEETLERLQTDYVDIYIMHRDNKEIPVDEFVDVLNELKDAGKIKIFGGSNWSIKRFEEANVYAEKKSKQGFSVLSNNFSLAEMIDPVWRGCISVSDAKSRSWLEQSQIPVFAWSSQARGFFTVRSGPDKNDEEELVRCWYSKENFMRKERAKELAEKKGVLPITIAAAYVLNQPFPVVALIGPRRIHETATSLQAFDINLTQDEIKWLNLED